MESAEGGSVPNAVGYGERCPLSSRLGGEHRELPQRGPGQSPCRKRVLAYFEGHRTLLFVSIWQNSEGRGQFALASPTPNSGGTYPPRPPWSTPIFVRFSSVCSTEGEDRLGRYIPYSVSGVYTDCFFTEGGQLRDQYVSSFAPTILTTFLDVILLNAIQQSAGQYRL